MLMESFVAIMALCAACVLDPGIYFAMNSPAAVIGDTPQRAAEVISGWGWVITPETITQTANDVGERTGGAPTLAVGMAQIMAQAFGGKALEAFWYHFAILFEALFILTAVDAGTRAGRFMIQDLLGNLCAPLGRTESVFSNVVATPLCVGAWGWFVYQGTNAAVDDRRDRLRERPSGGNPHDDRRHGRAARKGQEAGPPVDEPVREGAQQQGGGQEHHPGADRNRVPGQDNPSEKQCDRRGGARRDERAPQDCGTQPGSQLGCPKFAGEMAAHGQPVERRERDADHEQQQLDDRNCHGYLDPRGP